MHLGRLPASEVAEVCEEAVVVGEPRVCGNFQQRVQKGASGRLIPCTFQGGGGGGGVAGPA